ncbi:MAG: prolipoprotein diacylglyceryl transferase, partial [Bdellovibrionales bacterium]
MGLLTVFIFSETPRQSCKFLIISQSERLLIRHTHDRILAMVHSLSPFVIQFSENFGVRWYGLSYLVGFLFAYLVISWLVEKQNAGLNRALVGDYITTAAIGTLVGGRLGYCVFYSPDLFFKFKSDFPFWGVLAVNEGGMASHGGIIGIILASLYFARKYRFNSLYSLDLAAVAGPMGVFFGRIANFINGELVGRPAPEGFKFGVKFPQDLWTWPATEPSRVHELADAAQAAGIPRESWLSWSDQLSNPQFRQQIYDGISQMIHEIQKGNESVKSAVEPLLILRHPSQLYAAFGEGLLIFLVLFFLWRRPRKPGFMAASFICLYACNRIITEMFRTPDAHIGFQWLDLTRGQWLSIAMLSIGLGLAFVWSRASSLP